MTFSHASKIIVGAVTITLFDSGNAWAICATFHVTPKSPLHVALKRLATSTALA